MVGRVVIAEIMKPADVGLTLDEALSEWSSNSTQLSYGCSKLAVSICHLEVQCCLLGNKETVLMK